MILIIRGHIRESFKTKKLYDLIKNIHNACPELKIYIHTWNVIANNISWRKINSNGQNVNKEIIYNYFDDLQQLINHIIIDDDSNIKLIGNLEGKINKSLMPILGWKNYWYGKYRIIDYLFNNNIDEKETVVNLRFDILDNSNSVNEKLIIEFIKTNSDSEFARNKFIADSEKEGIDNIYIGNVKTMHKLINEFFNNLDDILLNNNSVKHPEKLVYRINSELFD